MMPPSDSIRHHLQKLAEVRANRNTSSAPPSNTAPPPYTLSVSRPSGTSIMNIDQYDHDDPYSTPIDIHIDTSVTVIGDGNTIMLPPGLGSLTNPTDFEPQSSSPRLSSLAAVVIAALNRANSLHDDFGNPRPLSINIKSGIRVQGRNNTVRTGGAAPPKKQTADTAMDSQTELNNNTTRTAGGEGSERKRRADSEPVESAPAAQRRRFS